MGFVERLLGIATAEPQLVMRDEEVSAVADAIYAEIEQRRASFGIEQAMRLPPVVRGVGLITSIASSFLPLAYRDGAALPIQPRIVAKPDPFRPRSEFVSQTVRSLIRDGCTYWWHPRGDRDPESGKPRQAIVLPHDEVNVQWDERRTRPLYDWRGMPLVLGQDITHIAINQGAGELHGRSPLRDGLQYLQPIAAAEDYARDWFLSGGVPPVVIKALGQKMTTTEIDRVKQRWVDARTIGSAPAVIDKDFDLNFPPVNPQSGQMQESRAYGNTVVATLLGIPPALLMVQTSGATITYTNPSSAVEDLVKSTIAPTYLTPVESAWSELTPRSQAVRFDLADLQRADFAARAAIYAQLIPQGVMTAEEARAFEGWGPVIDSSHAFDAAPDPEPSTTEVPSA